MAMMCHFQNLHSNVKLGFGVEVSNKNEDKCGRMVRRLEFDLMDDVFFCYWLLYVEWYDVSDRSLYCVLPFLLFFHSSFLTSTGFRGLVVPYVDSHGAGFGLLFLVGLCDIFGLFSCQVDCRSSYG